MKRLLSLLTVILCFSAVSFAGSKISTQYRNALILAYSQANSVYEDDNIKLEIYDEKLWATNKTNKTVFIDLSQCFLTHNGSSFPMFENKQDEKHASKKGVSTSIDEFLTIAPATGSKQNATFICNMTTGIFGTYTTTETPNGDFTDYDKRFFELIAEMISESQNADKKGKECVGSVSRHLTEDESINNIGASVAYAFNKRSENWESVSLSTWVCDVVFAPYYVEMPRDLKKKEKRGFGVKETAPAKIHVRANTPFEFDEDKSPLIVCDWEGNYKKGTFNLTTTYISKTKNVGLAILLAGVTGGASAALIRQDVYKRTINFDGIESDWGKLTFVKDIMLTHQ